MSGKSKGASPPRFGKWLLESFCSYDFLSTALWDLDELFQINVETRGVYMARLIYLREAIGIIFYLLFRGKSQYSINKVAMLKHNILISIRSFKKYKSTFLINLFGLSIGLASALLIYLWVNDELSMDHFGEKDSQRHYQVMVNTNYQNGVQTEETTHGPLSEALVSTFPEIDYAVPMITVPWYEGMLSSQSEFIRAVPHFATQEYFNLFRSEFVAGSKAGSLSDKSKIVISEKMAWRLFTSPDEAVGRTVSFKGYQFTGPYIVSGVFSSDNENSLDFDVLFSYDLFLEENPGFRQWDHEGTRAHLVMNEGVDIDAFNRKIKDFLKTKIEDSNQTLFVQKYSDKYLYGKYENGFPVAGRVVYVRIFSLIAIFVLLVACINYMNLSTAQAARRIKEIGVKKALGAQRSTLIYQCFGESVFISILSLILAIGFVILLLPHFNQITEKTLSIAQAAGLLIPILIITLITGLVSGVYPGLYLSGFKPVNALKGKLRGDSGALWIRQGLVVFQFAVSVVLIIAVIFTYIQIQYMQNFSLGYNNEHLLVFKKEGKLRESSDAFLEAVRSIPGVTNISHMSGSLPGKISGGSDVQWKNQEEEERDIDFSFIEGDYDMAALLQVELVAGRFLSRDIATDQTSVVLNETAAQLTGYENPIGERIYFDEMLTIVGVVKDFHFDNIQAEIAPFFFKVNQNGKNFVVRLRAENQRETISKIEDLHHAFNPGYPFELNFIDEQYDKLYKEDERIATLSKYFAAIAIIVSCLGLLALAAYNTQRRFKEIAIRKVLGSSNSAIVQLLSKEFIVLILISILIAMPVGYFLVKSWLDGFAHRIGLNPSYFIAAGALMLAVALLTVISQTAKTANMNVPENLRND